MAVFNGWDKHMIIRVDGRMSDWYYVLGVQEIADLDVIMKSFHSKAKHFAPNSAKSYTIKDISHYNSETKFFETFRYESETPTGNARCFVEYFTTKKEGEFLIDTTK